MMEHEYARRVTEAASNYRTAALLNEDAKRTTHNASVALDAAISEEQAARKRKSDARDALDAVLHEGLS